MAACTDNGKPPSLQARIQAGNCYRSSSGEGSATGNNQEHSAPKWCETEMSAQRFYVAIIEKGKGGFGVFFPDLPGCTSFGRTIAKAAENAYVAAQAHAAIAQEYGEKLPPPSDPDKIPRDPDVQEKGWILIPIETAEEPVRVNISLPASALAALDRTARELSLSRSGAIAHLALAHERSSEVRNTDFRAGRKKITSRAVRHRKRAG